MLVGSMMWLLVSMSSGVYNYGNVTIVGQFPTQESCQKVAEGIKSISRSHAQVSCIYTGEH